MKFTIKRLIALFLTSIRSDAQVNMKRLAEVTKSCQQDVFSQEYYQQMLLDVDQWDNNDLEKWALASLLWSQLKSPKFNADKFKP